MKRILCLVAMAQFFCSCGVDKPKEEKGNRDSVTDENVMKDPKNFFRDCKYLFAKASRLDSILYTQTELNVQTANEAIKSFTDYAYYCANDSISPVFLIKTAQIASTINNITQAKMTLEKCIQDYQNFEGLPTAIFLLAQLYDEKEYLNNEQEAKRLYEEVIARFPDSPEAESARGAIKFLGLTDKEIIKKLKQEQNKSSKVTIQ